MKLQGNISINNKTYTAGTEIPWYKVYPFFLGHMLVFGKRPTGCPPAMYCWSLM